MIIEEYNLRHECKKSLKSGSLSKTVIIYVPANRNGNQFDNKLLGIKFWMDSKKEVSYGF